MTPTMSNAINPYRAPDVSAATLADRAPPTNTLALVVWPVAFGLNSLLPAYMFVRVSNWLGLMGVALATVVLLACGWLGCRLRPGWMRLLMLGSIPIGVSQFVPVVHIGAGLVGLVLANVIGLVHRAPGVPVDRIESTLAGFVVAIVMLGLIWLCAAVLGVVGRWVIVLGRLLLGLLPARWSERKR